MLSRSNSTKQKDRCQCTCPRNRLDGLILTQEQAISIHRIIQFVAANLPISNEDRHIAIDIFEQRCQQCTRCYGWDDQQLVPMVHRKNRKGDE